MSWKEFGFIVAAAALSTIIIRLVTENAPAVAHQAGLTPTA